MAITDYERAERVNARRHREVQAAKAAKKAKKKAKRQPPVTVIFKREGKPAIQKAKPKRLKFGNPPTYRKGMASDEFYQTREWMDLRYATIARYGPQCQCCGAHKSATVWLHIDHIKPRSKYPDLELDPENLQVLCRECNIGKSNKYEHDWR